MLFKLKKENHNRIEKWTRTGALQRFVLRKNLREQNFDSSKENKAA